jgi:hypothetical protein
MFQRPLDRLTHEWLVELDPSERKQRKFQTWNPPSLQLIHRDT